MCILTLPACMWGVRSPGFGVTDSYELPCGCWELNPGPLEERPVLNCWAISPTHIYFIFYVFACMYVYAVCAYGAHRDQERASAPLELEFQLWATMYVLRTKPEFPGGAASALSHWVFCPAPNPGFLIMDVLLTPSKATLLSTNRPNAPCLWECCEVTRPPLARKLFFLFVYSSCSYQPHVYQFWPCFPLDITSHISQSDCLSSAESRALTERIPSAMHSPPATSF